MGISFNGETITLEAVIYEDEVVSLREKLTELAPAGVLFDLSDCDDVHLSVIQQMLAYKKIYGCDFKFSVNERVYQKVIEGFDQNECDNAF